MLSIFPVVEPREGYVNNAKGESCMVVVDPASCKLLIPRDYVFPTRAQQRTTIPSLCQLFLDNRCRFGSQCHQVHADISIVTELRNQVKSLPCCCPLHGDDDIGEVLRDGSWLSNVVLHIPESTYEGGFIPLSRVGYTVPLSRLLNEIPMEAFHAISQYEHSSEDGRPPRVVLEADTIPICRLHGKARCSYAEECNFLHLCKEVVEHDADLPLGRRSGTRTALKTRGLRVNEPQSQQQQQQAPSQSPQLQASHWGASFSTSSSNIFVSAPLSRPTASVRGFPILQRAGEGGRSPATYSFSFSGDAGSSWLAGVSSTSSLFNYSHDVCGRDRVASVASSAAAANAHSTTTAYSHSNNNNNTTNTVYATNPAGVERHKVTVEIDTQLFPSALGTIDFAGDSRHSLVSGANNSGLHASPISVRTGFSDSLGALSRDEGASTASSGASTTQRCRTAGKWRHNPYDGAVKRVFV
ncbi:hypothetical protein LSM04_009522 [Trypanosoma melophagium]|uniref:uncharacterized protein n=1 Tax=Trypanosoma melophagium TaxID=715481 RepID=UPI003519F4D1|nr:hypothetical protein LSM04_009522 [Trypanosoma melophagium]